MKKKIIIAAMAACLVMGTTEAGFASTCSRTDRLQEMMQKLEQYISEQIRLPEPEKPDSEEENQNGSGEVQGTMTAQVVNLVNSERAAQGLGKLRADSQLSRLAQMKAEDMARNGYFSHTSPTYGSAFDMLKTYGVTYKSAGENIAMGQRTAQSVMNSWMNSPGHRANILSSQYSQIGVGVAENGKGTIYWVQLFKG